jgi:hypothetical protein
MKKKALFSILVCFILLTGCSKQETFEGFFNRAMNEMHKGEKNYSYLLIYKKFNTVHKDDAIAVFTEDRKQEKEVIYIAYFEKINGKWYWKQTTGTIWNSPVKWTYMERIPYIYLGAINDNSISKIYVGSKQAKIIKVEGNKRFWYAVSEVKGVQVKAIKSNGTQEIIKQIEYGSLTHYD